MIRPEALQALHRWREVLVGLALLAVGVWFAAQPGYLLPALGAVLAIAGLALAIIAVRRARFAARGGAGPGVVQVVEGQIGFFGPHDGGVVAIDDIAALWLSADAAEWRIRATDGRLLAIPRGARGAEALFDTFAALDGFDMPALLRALDRGPAPSDRLLWQRRTRVLLT